MDGQQADENGLRVSKPVARLVFTATKTETYQIASRIAQPKFARLCSVRYEV